MFYARLIILAARLGFAIALAVSTALTPARDAGAETIARVVGDGTPASCTEAALRAAVTAGGEITFDCGDNGTNITITAPLAVTNQVSIDGEDSVSLYGGDNTRLFEVASNGSLTLLNILLRNAGPASGDGGAIANAGALTLERVQIIYSKASPANSGGAIFTSGPATLREVRFLLNEAGSAGAIFANGPGARVSIDESELTDNKAQSSAFGYGGAIWVGNGAKLIVTDSVFLANKARLGGAVFVSPQGNVLITGNPGATQTQLTRNVAALHGGAIYNEGYAFLTGVFLIANTASEDGGYGGAIFTTGILTLVDTRATSNSSRFGGAVYGGYGGTNTGRVSIERSVFASNGASQSGGAIYSNVREVQITITKSHFESNTATNGGAIAKVNSALYLYDSSLVSNTVKQAGGAVHALGLPNSVYDSGTFVVDSSIGANRSDTGTGGGFFNSGRLYVSHSTIAWNAQGLYRNGDSSTELWGVVFFNPANLNCAGAATGTITDKGYSFANDTSCGVRWQGNTLDPAFGPLRTAPGQHTYFYEPNEGSPLLGQVASAEYCDYVDQLNRKRPYPCAIGAIERMAPPPTPTPTPTVTATPTRTPTRPRATATATTTVTPPVTPRPPTMTPTGTLPTPTPTTTVTPWVTPTSTRLPPALTQTAPPTAVGARPRVYVPFVAAGPP